MDAANFIPNDLRECQRLLLAAFQQATQMERRVAESEQRVARAQPRVDAGHSIVDVLASQRLARVLSLPFPPLGDDFLPDGLQPLGAELVGRGIAVQANQRRDGSLDRILLVGGDAVLDVVRLGEIVVLDDQGGNGQPLPLRYGNRGRLPVADILGDEAGVRLLALRRPVGAEVNVASIDANTGLPRGRDGADRRGFCSSDVP